jgi:hypothetical protein
VLARADEVMRVLVQGRVLSMGHMGLGYDPAESSKPNSRWHMIMGLTRETIVQVATTPDVYNKQHMLALTNNSTLPYPALAPGCIYCSQALCWCVVCVMCMLCCVLCVVCAMCCVVHHVCHVCHVMQLPVAMTGAVYVFGDTTNDKLRFLHELNLCYTPQIIVALMNKKIVSGVPT